MAGHLRRLGRDERGLTLVELLITMVLMGLVGSLVLSVYSTSADVVVDNDRRLDSVNIATIGMERLSKAIRAGTEIKQHSAQNLPAFRSVATEAVSFYSYLGSEPSLITFSINGNRELTETVVPADAASTEPYWTFTGASTTRIVARKIPAGLATPLFRYYDGGGAQISPTTNQDELRRIEQVQISLTVQADPTNSVRAAVLENRVALPNLGFARRR
jgi:prepilin-type N-terminal cleavage/methylation domain-containing protein